MAERRSWSAIKGARRDTAARREGYRRARDPRGLLRKTLIKERESGW